MVFIDKIKSLYPISSATERMLVDSVIVCRFPRKHLLVKAGEYCRSAYFIEKGMTRSYWLVDGNEITTSFSGEGDIVFSMDELYYNKVSEEYVEALEDMVAYRIGIGDLLELFRTNIEIANWGRIIHQNEYRRLHRSHRDRLTLSAGERYVEFRKQFPPGVPEGSARLYRLISRDNPSYFEPAEVERDALRQEQAGGRRAVRR